MKLISLTAVLMGAMNTHKLHGDDVYELKGGYQRHLNGDADFEDWFEVPHEKISVDDEHWGHEVQHVPKGDWLDKHVKEVAAIQAWLPPKPSKDDRKAVADS